MGVVLACHRKAAIKKPPPVRFLPGLLLENEMRAKARHA
jgi:hypothetical protein